MDISQRKGGIMREKFDRLQPYLDKAMAISTSISLFNWDRETLAPKLAAENTAKVMGLLASESYEAIMNDEVKKLVYEISEAIEKEEVNSLTEVEKGIVKELKKEYEILEKIPQDEYREFSELKGMGSIAWEEAKKKDSYDEFLPVFERLVEGSRKFAKYRKKDEKTLYDVLLNDYEEGFTTEVLDGFFDKLKQKIVPLLKEIREKEEIKHDFLFKKYDVEKQHELSRFIAEYVGFKFERGVMAVSAHPFTNSLHNKDVRITTHYYENNIESAIFSTIHETGHAIYEMNIPDELTQTMVGTGTSMGMHESQSRFFENIVGRSKSFWKPIYNRLEQTFSEELKDVSLDAFISAINRVHPGFIRTEADELTYSLHILIRYEVEKKIFNEDYPVSKLPELWNDLYEEYLGIRPSTYKEGILQDVHWSEAYFGYFPSYALGNAISAQLFNTMKKELDFDKILESGELYKITDWFSDRIYKYGKLKNTNEILNIVTGEQFNADYYIEYLLTKFKNIYSI